MNRKSIVITAIVLSIGSFYTYAMKNDDSIVPNSSYVVHKVETDIAGGMPVSSKFATFYTAQGDPITSIEYGFTLQQKVDSKASKPQPVRYEIKYLPAIKFAYGVIEGGNYIFFYDKNGNIINRFRYDKSSDEISVDNVSYKLSDVINDSNSFPLDLSNLEK